MSNDGIRIGIGTRVLFDRSVHVRNLGRRTLLPSMPKGQRLHGSVLSVLSKDPALRWQRALRDLVEVRMLKGQPGYVLSLAFRC